MLLLKFLPIYKYKISGESMNPTLKNNDIVLVNRLSYVFSNPKLQDIIAARNPGQKKILIKRISEIKNRKYFILGDNKAHSTDSRTFGWITKKDIIGKVIYNSKFKTFYF